MTRRKQDLVWTSVETPLVWPCSCHTTQAPWGRPMSFNWGQRGDKCVEQDAEDLQGQNISLIKVSVEWWMFSTILWTMVGKAESSAQKAQN